MIAVIVSAVSPDCEIPITRVFLSAMVSSKNYPKEEKLISVFNLLNESEVNKNYITYESLMNAVKALNLNINEGEIKKCFQHYDNEIYNIIKKWKI